MSARALPVVAGVLLITLASATPSAAKSVDDVPAVQSGDAGEIFEVELFDLSAARRLYQALARQRPTMTEGERVAAWADFSLTIEAVAGEPVADLLAFDDLARALASGLWPRVRATRGVAGRDGVAYLMLAVGYSARETADVVSGRIDRPALDMARRMIAAGLGRDTAADFLDRQYASVKAWRDAQNAPPIVVEQISFGPFDDLIEHYASMHAVEAALVRAIIQVESAFNPAARSHAGAIGLMQLMPATAQELGVNPFVPEQNIEGGVRYFSQMLRKFGAVDLALVAYNAGPGFAERYIRGQAALYGETREYVSNVMARFNRLR